MEGLLPFPCLLALAPNPYPSPAALETEGEDQVFLFSSCPLYAKPGILYSAAVLRTELSAVTLGSGSKDREMLCLFCIVD